MQGTRSIRGLQRGIPSNRRRMRVADTNFLLDGGGGGDFWTETPRNG